MKKRERKLTFKEWLVTIGAQAFILLCVIGIFAGIPFYEINRWHAVEEVTHTHMSFWHYWVLYGDRHIQTLPSGGRR